mgnify:CR=1 FL=1
MPDNDNDSELDSTADLARDSKKGYPAATAVATAARPSEEEALNLEDAFGRLFKSSVSGTGEEDREVANAALAQFPGAKTF